MRGWIAGLAALAALSGAPGRVEVATGRYVDPARELAGGDRSAALALRGDVTLDWQTGTWTGDIDTGGHTLTVETGGGNETRLLGSVTGGGALVWNGGGAGHWQLVASYLGGRRPNGTFRMQLMRGTLAMAKPDGVTTLAGPVVVGGGGNQAILRWEASEQVADDSPMTLTGPSPARLRLQGHAETLGSLTLAGDGEVDLGGPGGCARFADSRATVWTAGAQLIIAGWRRVGDVRFGADGRGLTAEQIACVGFRDPAGRAPGLYRAQLEPAGYLAPSSRRVEPRGVAWDLSARGRRERAALCRTGGLDRLTLAVRPGMRFAFFGDSITWLSNGSPAAPANGASANPVNDFGRNAHTYNLIGRAVDGRGVTLSNHAINGGGVREILDGREHMGAAAGTVIQPSMREILRAERPTAVVVFIGTNDAWWRETPPADFTVALEAIADEAAAVGARLVLATPALIGERPDGANPRDRALDAVAEAVRRAARERRAALADLRAVSLAYLRNANLETRLDGRALFAESGLLTYDGVHPSDAGAALFAAHIADAVVRVLPPDSPSTDGRDPRRLRLVPWPTEVRMGAGVLRLAPGARVTAGSLPLLCVARGLAARLSRTTGQRFVASVGAPRPGEIGLMRSNGPAGGAYMLTVDDRVRIAAGDPVSAACGSATVLQLACAARGGVALPRLTVRDRPAVAYRGLMVDVARQHHPVAELRRIVEMCALYKIRYLQLHLTDDQAWRFPSVRYPLLGSANQTGPAYTRGELMGLVACAEERGVAIIPELEGPGHCGAAARAMPGIFDAVDPAAGGPVGLGCMNMAHEGLYAALDTLIGEMCDVFRTAPFIHIGADEVWLGAIERAPGYAGYLKRNGLSSGTDLYCHFIARVAAMVRRRGRQPIVWEGFPGSGTRAARIPRDVVVMSFENTYNPAPDLVRAGYPVINTAWTPLYGPLIRSIVGPEQVYGWNIHRLGRYPAQGYDRVAWIDLPAGAPVLGAQMCAWELPAARELPAIRDLLPAMAERIWSPDAGRSYADFRRRWTGTDRLLDRLTLPAAGADR